MPISKFISPATLEADGTITVRGDLEVDPPAAASDVEIRFMLVQGDVVVEGTGTGGSAGWVGTTAAGQAKLHTGSAQAFGLAFLARKGPDPRFEPFTWDDPINLVPA